MPETSAEQSRGAGAGMGLLCAGIGLYLTLVGFDLLPPPGRAGAPGWVVVACGLVFLFGGSMVVLQALGGAGRHGAWPGDTPRWVTLLQHAAVLLIAGCFAAIGTWVSLFGQADRFGGSVTAARIGFGVGAVIMWLVFAALARRALRAVTGTVRS